MISPGSPCGEFTDDTQYIQSLVGWGGAFMILTEKISAHGIFCMSNDVNVSLGLTFTGFNPRKTYDLTFFSRHNNFGWDEASLVTLSEQVLLRASGQ